MPSRHCVCVCLCGQQDLHAAKQRQSQAGEGGIASPRLATPRIDGNNKDAADTEITACKANRRNQATHTNQRQTPCPPSTERVAAPSRAQSAACKAEVNALATCTEWAGDGKWACHGTREVVGGCSRHSVRTQERTTLTHAESRCQQEQCRRSRRRREIAVQLWRICMCVCVC